MIAVCCDWHNAADGPAPPYRMDTCGWDIKYMEKFMQSLDICDTFYACIHPEWCHESMLKRPVCSNFNPCAAQWRHDISVNATACVILYNVQIKAPICQMDAPCGISNCMQCSAGNRLIISLDSSFIWSPDVCIKKDTLFVIGKEWDILCDKYFWHFAYYTILKISEKVVVMPVHWYNSLIRISMLWNHCITITITFLCHLGYKHQVHSA